MSDTVRTLAANLANLADNTTGNITPQMLRDAVVSLQPVYGSLYMSTPAATTPGVAGTYLKVLGTTTLVSTSNNLITSTASNRLVNNSGVAKTFLVSATISVVPGSAAANRLGFKIAKNGALLDDSESKITTTASTTNEVFVQCQATVDLAAGDYVEVYGTNFSNTNTFTVNNMNLSMRGQIL